MKRKLLITAIVLLAVALGYLWLRPNSDKTAQSQNSSGHPSTTNQQSATASFNKTKYSLTDPTSLWAIVNKTHPLIPKDYVPADLVFPDVTQRVPGTAEMKMRAQAAQALKEMFTAGQQAGVRLLISTAYRGYSYQKTLYTGYVASQGQAVADTQSARPGYSEHQTGLAVDIRAQSGRCPVEQCFGELPEGKWLAANAYKYGFVLRYPKGKEAITGYEYEPWHFRYVGTYLSQEMHKQGVTTLEEFFGVSGGTRYN